MLQANPLGHSVGTSTTQPTFFFLFLLLQLAAFTAEIFVVSCQAEILLLWTTKYYSSCFYSSPQGCLVFSA